jgi:F-type H+-transporting ATPase subunit delta
MNSPLAIRYARALLGAAQKQNTISAVDTDITMIACTLTQYKSLFKILAHPVLDFSKKEAVVKAVFGGTIGELSMHFLNLCIRKKRILYFQEMAKYFTTLCHAQTNTVEITARSAFALSDETKQKIIAALAAMLNKSIQLKTETDTTLLAGLQLWMGDAVIDNTVATQLKNLQEKLLA